MAQNESYTLNSTIFIGKTQGKNIGGHDFDSEFSETILRQWLIKKNWTSLKLKTSCKKT